jgi:hypothetical protein
LNKFLHEGLSIESYHMLEAVVVAVVVAAAEAVDLSETMKTNSY